MSKLKLKEKVLIWYDHVFNYDEALFEQPNFWDEFFLLRFLLQYTQCTLNLRRYKVYAKMKSAT